MLRIFKQYYPIRNVFFVLGEGLFIYGATLIGSWIILGENFAVSDIALHLKILLVALVCQTFLYYNDLYDLTVTDSYPELGIRLLQSLGASAFFLAGVYALFPDAIIAKGAFATGVVMVILFVVSWRVCYMVILSRGLFNQNIILVGAGELACEIVNEIARRKDSGYSVSFSVTGRQREAKGRLKAIVDAGIPCQQGFENLSHLANEKGIGIIVVALEDRRGSFPTEALLECRVNGINILDGVSFYEMLTGKLIVEQIKPGWLIFSDGFRKSRLRRFIKRTIDLFLSAFLLVTLSPLLAITALLIKIDSRGPVIFSQDRVGQYGKDYRMHKFRSMIADAEKQSGPVWAQSEDHRITRVGRFIRRTRVDELPQLWNVLRGEMSFVGPRPERAFFVKQLEEIIPYYRERYTVKPGLTGWAQVSYGYGATVEDAIEKLNYDLFYIKNMSVFMDLMIVAKTVKIVLFGKGVR